jgi:hypothetical protein
LDQASHPFGKSVKNLFVTSTVSLTIHGALYSFVPFKFGLFKKVETDGTYHLFAKYPYTPAHKVA